MTNLNAPGVVRQPVSVTRKMSASLPRLRKVAQDKGLKIHHLGAGYPHPEVTDPRGFIAHEAAYLEHLTELEGQNDPAALPEHLREAELFVFASSCENLPNILIEGMAAGLPIACSRRPPMPEVLGDAGESFDPEAVSYTHLRAHETT